MRSRTACRFGAWLVFAAVWVTLVYLPLAHMVWGGGLLGAGENGIAAAIYGVTDGIAKWPRSTSPVARSSTSTPVVAGLVLALIIGKRKGFGKEPMRPHNLPFVMLGAALLWFGWFGFNAGSAEFAADERRRSAPGSTPRSRPAPRCSPGSLTEKLRDGHATRLGAASGIVAGLVAITPAAAAVDPIGAIVIGAVAGVLCALAVGLKYRFGYDDSLDVVGVHLVGGLVGTILIGLLRARTTAPALRRRRSTSS